jgi:hypothetical protein
MSEILLQAGEDRYDSMASQRIWHLGIPVSIDDACFHPNSFAAASWMATSNHGAQNCRKPLHAGQPCRARM